MNAEQHEWYWKGYNDAKKEQREFVGMTDDEINKAYADSYRGIPLHESIEAKLRSKNGY